MEHSKTWNQLDIYNFARSIGSETKDRGNELTFKYCPYCNGGQHNDKYTFSINRKTGAYNCLRSTCGKHGHFVQICNDFGYKLKSQSEYAYECNQTKKYKKFPETTIVVRENAIKYMKSRGISEETTRRYKITTYKNNPDIIVFPFYDENENLTFVKYRDSKYYKGKLFPNGKPSNKEWSQNGAKPILFGMAQCVDFTTLVITEGQIDSLSLADVGIKNAVSVPTGAKGMTWIQHCYEWLNKFEEIIVMGDCENGKITMVEEINLRLANKVVKYVPMEYYLGEKDANDIYRKYGGNALVNAIENAKPVQVPSVKRLADVGYIDLASMEHVNVGIPAIDRAIGGLYFGQVVLLTGKRGEGKSTFMSQIGCEVLNQGYNCFFYSGELPDVHFKQWMFTQLAGINNLVGELNSQGDYEYKVPQDVCEKINNWLADSAYIYDNDYVADNMPTLLQTIIKSICQYNVRFICIDNLMTAIEYDSASELYRKQSEFVRELKSIASKYNVCILLVAHPRKESNGDNKHFQNDDISGSADITNRVDTVMVYSRAKPTKECKSPNWDSEVIVTKNRLTGRLINDNASVKLVYSTASKRIMQLGDTTVKAYNWENNFTAECENDF